MLTLQGTSMVTISWVTLPFVVVNRISRGNSDRILLETQSLACILVGLECDYKPLTLS